MSRPLMFYLNARDEKCDENFVWCDGKKEALGADLPWLSLTEPDDFNGNENCVLFTIGTDGGISIADVPCFVKALFICEVI
jgi:hypothetical protein